MSKITYSLRVEEETKEEFDAVCEKLGISPSSAVNLFITKMAREKKIPFELSVSTEKEA